MSPEPLPRCLFLFLLDAGPEQRDGWGEGAETRGYHPMRRAVRWGRSTGSPHAPVRWDEVGPFQTMLPKSIC